MPRRIAKPSEANRRRTFIAQWRKYRGLSQEALAERLETTKASISRIETGLQPYSQDFLEAVAYQLQCEPVDLLIRDPSDPDGIWSIWDHAKPGEKKQIVEVSRVIVGGRTGTEG